MKRAICAAAAVLAVLAGSPGPAAAVHIQSEGCQVVNDPFFDGFRTAAGLGPEQFFAGETITVTATEPISGDAPTTVVLEVPQNTPVSTAPFPGTATYTFLADTVTSVEWRVITRVNANVTWTVSCQGAVHYPLAVFADHPASEVATPGAAVAVESSRRTDFPLAAVGVAALAVFVQFALWRGTTCRRRLIAWTDPARMRTRRYRRGRSVGTVTSAASSPPSIKA